MTRAEMVEKLFEMAQDLTSNYYWDKAYAFFNLVSDWNLSHSEEEEIFVSEIYKEDGYENDGISVEDDIFYYN